MQSRTTSFATLSLCAISISVTLFSMINTHYAHKILISLADKFKKNNLQNLGDHGSTVVKALRYKSEGRWFDPNWSHWNFSLT
jgi:hypothetical protein